MPLAKSKPVQNLKTDLRSVIAKMMEYYPIQHMRNTCQVVDGNQFGAVQGSSTTPALLQILQPVYQATDNSKNYARLLVIDFSKAFDHIDHQILLHKLDQNGVHPLIPNWYNSFLQGRQQRVKMGKPTSKWLSVNGGVSQRTLSGPELFIHMLSDFKTVTTDVKFVDDSTLVDTGNKNPKSARMQEAANEAAILSKENSLGINETKKGNYNDLETIMTSHLWNSMAKKLNKIFSLNSCKSPH